MPLVFDSVLTAALARELDAAWSGRRLEAARFDEVGRRVRLGFTAETWVWLLHPLEGVLAPVQRRARADDAGRASGERHRGLLAGPRRIVAVESPADTRALILRLDGPDAEDERLVFDLVTSRWNVLHVRAGRVHSILLRELGRDPVRPGDPWEPPVSGRRWARTAPDLGDWSATLDELSAAGRPTARSLVAWLSSMNEAMVLGDGPAAAAADEASRAAALRRYLALRTAALEAPPTGWLLPWGRATEADGEPDRRIYPLPLDVAGAERAGSLLDAMLALAARRGRVADALRTAAEDPDRRDVRQALEQRIERSNNKIRSLEAELDTGRDPDELRQLGHLLLARKAAVPTGAAEARLEGFGGEPVTVSLDPSLDAVGNAEAFYDEAKRLERAAARIPGRIEAERRRLAGLTGALERLEAGESTESIRTLAGVPKRADGCDGRRGASTPERLPYRSYRTSSGLEIRAGRSATGNDELTFRHSAPDDIWMHVRESPGSHVVLRWGRRDQNPPEADLVEAAQVAAVLSRARGSGIVPVAWTRRKYVRKPRKAAPGAVVPERTRTVFVEPDPKRVARMAETETGT